MAQFCTGWYNVLSSYCQNKRNRNRKNTLNSQIKSLRNESANLIIEGKVNERHKISSQLHDSICLLLTNIRLKLSGLSKENISSEQINDLSETLLEISEDIRRIARGEGPNSPINDGFNEAMYKLIQLSSDSNTQFEIHYFNKLGYKIKLSEEIIELLYFIS